MKKYVRPEIRVRTIECSLMESVSYDQQEGGTNTGRGGGQYSKPFNLQYRDYVDKIIW